jgi:hypothetical protein
MKRETTMTLRSWLRGLTVLAIAACVPGPSRIAAAPAPAAPAAIQKPVAKAKASVYSPRNRHLHTVTTPTTPTTPTKTTSLHARTARPSAAPHSTTATRRVRHTPRAAASVSGTVHNARGGPAANARVWLAKPNGVRIRSAPARHGTRADSSGAYSMRGVKSGRYRVVALKRGAGRGHRGVMVRRGGAQHANINLQGARPKASRQR